MNPDDYFPLIIIQIKSTCRNNPSHTKLKGEDLISCDAITKAMCVSDDDD
jgi:hypothetical protein